MLITAALSLAAQPGIGNNFVASAMLINAALSLAAPPSPIVHVVPHSHLDTGWLKTVDQCYYGANSSIQQAGVQYILDALVASLNMNPNRTFTFAEQAFFTRWWEDRSEHVRDVVRGLVKRGQLKFVDGGWSQHDEGCAHFSTMLDQTAFGSAFLSAELGVRPTIGWHLDVFGHTATQAALLSAEVGFDALYFARIDYQDRDKRRREGRMEMLWRGSPSLGNEVFTGALVQGSYCSPSGLGWPMGGHDPTSPTSTPARREHPLLILS
jgi:alpha-mannosidase